ncbi:hypothetical protein KW507_07840 [Vibrio fluvialis]|nr:hypothetical protein [Vibrio fluvialis]
MKTETKKAESPKEVFEHVNLDYTALCIGAYDNINFNFSFPIMPFDYLNYAQKDMSENSQRGLINALANSKRSIDCLIEVVLRSLYIDPNNIEKAALDFCTEILVGKEKDISPASLRLFCALGFAPSFMISEVRNLRNKVEHEFQIPNELDVVRALEIAELLINNVKAKEIYSTTIDISDAKNYEPVGDGYITGVYFSEDYQTKSFQLLGKNKSKIECVYTFDTKDTEYYYFLRAMFVAYHDDEKLINTVYKLIEVLDVKTPRQFVKVKSTHR